MLVLTRKPGEEIVIGDPSMGGITVQVISVQGGRVKIGVTAPKTSTIARVNGAGEPSHSDPEQLQRLLEMRRHSRTDE